MSEYIAGIDAHKHSHTIVVVDAVGRKLDEKTIPATTPGHQSAITWMHKRFGRDVLWGVEDCRALTTRLENDLLGRGERVVRVAPHLMSRARASVRTPGKSDPIDALSVARAVLREPDLPVAQHDETSWTLKLLVDRRDDLVDQRRATINRILERIHLLEPTFKKPANWQVKSARARIAAFLGSQTPSLVVELARDELEDINRLTTLMNVLAERIAGIATDVAPALLGVPGCAELTAAKIVAETAGIERFRNEAAFARYIGVAPIPHMSGDAAVRMLPMRMGNRQLNVALHRIAITQIRITDSQGQLYHRKRLDAGDSRGQALRALKRRLSRVVYQALRQDRQIAKSA